MISIIIIVKNDKGVENTLNTLMEVEKPEKTEIIVVDASEGSLDFIKNKFPQIRWIYFHNKTNKKITIPEQRNLGIKRAKGEIICFIDAGCTINKNWLVELIKPIKTENEDFITGKIISLAKSIHNNSFKLREGKKYLTGSGTANIAFKKEIISKIGLFDCSFDYGSDMDFSLRAIDKGIKIRYAPSAIMYIDWGNFKQDLRRSFYYGIAKMRLFRKHGNIVKRIIKNPDDFFAIYAVLYFIYIISIPFIFPFFYFYPILLIIPFIKNIKNKPFRKLIADFFWGMGFLKELFFINNNAPNKK